MRHKKVAYINANIMLRSGGTRGDKKHTQENHSCNLPRVRLMLTTLSINKALLKSFKVESKASECFDLFFVLIETSV